MLSTSDFAKKQILFAFLNNNEKISFANDNIVIKDSNGKIKHQSTCYRLMTIFIVGQTTITTGFIQKARKFGFCIVLLTAGFRVYEIIGSKKDGNTILHRLQYSYDDLEIAKHITANKITNQTQVLALRRKKDEDLKKALCLMKKYREQIDDCKELSDIMGYEGIASKLYFKQHFNNVPWQGRKPRIKSDMLNSLLDIGYTLLFTYIEVLLNIYGFDVYCGVMHRCFYMRKSLVCDIMEPFRVLIDMQVKKAINLKQFKEEDFLIRNSRYDLKWEKSAAYISVILETLIENRENIFIYIQNYYRAFMRQKDISQYPVFNIKEAQ